MKGRVVLAFLIVTVIGIGLTIAGDGIKPTYRRSEKAYYLTDAQASFIRPGLHLTIQKVEYAPPAVKVTFQITDDAGQGLDRLGIQTPGPVSTSFVLARIKPGDTQYTSYFTKHVDVPTSPNIENCAACSFTGATADQPTTDSGGTYEDLGNGVYTYTFGNQLPADLDVDSTNTVGMYARRDLSAFGFPVNSIGTVANATLDFVPSGAPVTQVRDVVTTAACNQCHDPLAVHGGSRQDVRLCILCHNPGNTDPYTGNSLDFKVFIHKIHMGAHLPSVTAEPLNVLGASGGAGEGGAATPAIPGPVAAGTQPAGTPYQIIGYRNSIHDFSSVVWPQDVRNCTTCHQGGTQSDNYKNHPSRAACGSCHDNVNFATGENHPGGVQVDDSKCNICHPADGQEFDLSVTGAHTMPAASKQLAGINIKILEVTNTNPGDKPTVAFTVTDNDGNPEDISQFSMLRLTLAGPTSDYTFEQQEDARSAEAGPSGYTYTFKDVSIPSDASGSFAIGAEAYRMVTITGPLSGQSFNIRETAFNPVFYFGVGGTETVPRREVVDRNNCDNCHKNLALHGGIRKNTQYCILCHNPNGNDGGMRSAEQMPPQTINFRTMIHRIHRGDALENDWTIIGYQHSVNNFNGVLYPGDLRDCAKCHVNNSNEVPLPEGLADTPTPRLFYSPLKPTASACLGCHDGEDAAAHTYLMTAPFGESCPVCHEEGADFAVSKIHAR